MADSSSTLRPAVTIFSLHAVMYEVIFSLAIEPPRAEILNHAAFRESSVFHVTMIKTTISRCSLSIFGTILGIHALREHRGMRIIRECPMM